MPPMLRPSVAWLCNLYLICTAWFASTTSDSNAVSSVVAQTLADDKHSLAVVIPLGIGIGDVGGEADVARHALPQISKLVARVPDIVAGRRDLIAPGRRIIGGGSRHKRAADIGLAIED